MSSKNSLSVFSDASSLSCYNKNGHSIILNKSYNDKNDTNDTNNKNDINLDNCCNDVVLDKVYIDVAVVCQAYNEINIMCNDHIIILDEIDVTIETFQTIFYPYKDIFGLNKDFFLNNPEMIQLISFLPEYRSVNKVPFNLLEEIIGNIETDLGVLRNCFTKDSLVELTNEIISIKSLLDIKCCSVLSSLSWNNVLDIINNYSLNSSNVIPVLIVNIVFKTPTQGVKDTIIRFQYKICK